MNTLNQGIHRIDFSALILRSFLLDGFPWTKSDVVVIYTSNI